MSAQPPHRPRPGPRHPFAASAPAPHTQAPPVPSTPPPSYTPKDPLASDDRLASYPAVPAPPIPQPSSSAAPSSSSRRASNPGTAAMAMSSIAAAASHQQQQARRRSSAASRIAAVAVLSPSASTPDLGRTLSRDDASCPPLGFEGGGGGGEGGGGEAGAVVVPAEQNERNEPPSSALHPRVAVLLGINESFHVPLLLCRGLATAPAIWWFGRCLLLVWRLAVSMLKGGIERDVEWGVGGWRGGGVGGGAGFGEGGAGAGEAASLVVMEVALAALWCGASGYLSFYFADCLMSRWLLNYTPSATLVRLFTISAINVYTTSWWLHLSGASSDPRLLLPAWICIASTLTILYHLAHRHVNIRRETRAAVRAFWLTSTVSLWCLLLQSHVERETWKIAPLVGIVERVGRAWRDARDLGSGGGEEL